MIGFGFPIIYKFCRGRCYPKEIIKMPQEKRKRQKPFKALAPVAMKLSGVSPLNAFFACLGGDAV